MDHFEWTQAVQTGRVESVELIKDRRTTVRVYTKLSPQCAAQGVLSIPDVVAEGTIFETASSPAIDMMSETGSITVSSSNQFGPTARSSENMTFNFTFIPTLDEGLTMNLMVCVRPQSHSGPCEEWAVSQKSFLTVTSPVLLGAPFQLNQFDSPPTPSTFEPGEGDLGYRALLPITEAAVNYIVQEATVFWNGDESHMLSCLGSRWSVLARAKRAAGADMICAFRNGVRARSGALGVSCETGLMIGPALGQDKHITIAHEAFHRIVHDDGHPTGTTAEFGWDMDRPSGRLGFGRVKLPALINLMAPAQLGKHDDDYWIRPTQYRQSLESLGAFDQRFYRRVQPIPVIPDGSGGWALGAIVEEEVFGPPFHVGTTGEFELRSMDGASTVFSTRFEEPRGECYSEPDAECTMELGSQFELPGDPTIDQVVLLKNGSVVATRERSENAPEVSIDSPLPDSELTESTAIRWTASDDDDDDLIAHVDYSHDGVHAVPLGSFLSGSSGELTLGQIAALPTGTAAEIRVIVSDGFNTTRAIVTGLTITGNRAPRAYIVSPKSGLQSKAGSNLILIAAAHDAEDGVLAGGALSWASSVSGLIGYGAMLNVADLAVGSHTITLTVTDSASQSSTDSVSIEVY